MKRSNLISITRIYDIYPKYTYSDDVKKFMDEIVDIDRASVCTKEEVIAMLTKLQLEIKELWDNRYDVWLDNQYYIGKSDTLEEVDEVIQEKINALKGETDGSDNN